MTDSTAGALLNSIPDNLSSLLDNRGTEGGVYYNEEANSLLAEGDLHYDYQPNSCLSSELTDTQLSQLLNYLGDNNYITQMYHEDRGYTIEEFNENEEWFFCSKKYLTKYS